MKDMGQRNIFQFTTQMALINSKDGEYFPDVDKMKSSIEFTLSFNEPRSAKWPPKEAVCHIVLRVFDLKHYSVFSINDSPKVPLYLNYSFSKAPGEVHTSHLKIPVKYLKKGLNKIKLEARRLPDDTKDLPALYIKENEVPGEVLVGSWRGSRSSDGSFENREGHSSGDGDSFQRPTFVFPVVSASICCQGNGVTGFFDHLRRQGHHNHHRERQRKFTLRPSKNSKCSRESTNSLSSLRRLQLDKFR